MGEETKAIGLVVTTDAQGDLIYRNIEYTIRDGKVIKTVTMDDSYAVNDAINHATYWIDRQYWKEDGGP